MVSALAPGDIALGPDRPALARREPSPANGAGARVEAIAPAPSAGQPAPGRIRSARARAHRFPPVRWRDSRSLGLPYRGGRLVRGVMVPATGRHFFTWDPVERRSPNRAWRRWGTDDLVRTVLRVAREHRAANPGAPRLAIGDLSRAQGGDFGVRYGTIGHASHQNGRDIDIYYPRRDGDETAPPHPELVDLRLAQDLVDRFVRGGAERVFVGPSLGLDGPPGIVQPLAGHDNHLHVRMPPG